MGVNQGIHGSPGTPLGWKLMGVGNEQWDEQYIERYKVFEKAIHARIPRHQLVSGPVCRRSPVRICPETTPALQADLIDEHYYLNPRWFFDNAKRYDNYDRQGPKVFAGEYGPCWQRPGSGIHELPWLAALSRLPS